MAIIRLIPLAFCLLIISCSKTDSSLDVYFSELTVGGERESFPYKISEKDTVCVLQSYQHRLWLQPPGKRMEELNERLSKSGIRGKEGSWVFLIFSGDDIFFRRIDGYKNPLSSPVDSDHGQWSASNGAESEECALGGKMELSVFVNKLTGDKRVGIISTNGG